MPSAAAISYRIKSKATELGFSSCGIARAEELTEEARYLESWLNQQKHGQMGYMANHFDKRIDPTRLVEGAKSVISLSFNYYSDQKQTDPNTPRIAMYAYGRDYHDVVRERLERLLGHIREIAGDVHGRCFVDSAPVLERAWAQRFGIGWMGKNTNLLTKRQGSYFFLAEINSSIWSWTTTRLCGTTAVAVPGVSMPVPQRPSMSLINSMRASVSPYFTIELKDQLLPDEMKGKFENWMYGCDICQQVCRSTLRPRRIMYPEFEPLPELLTMTKADWEELSEDHFKKVFKGSAVKRTKYAGLKRNILSEKAIRFTFSTFVS
jgi:epoxyqueuosine reductase